VESLFPSLLSCPALCVLGTTFPMENTMYPEEKSFPCPNPLASKKSAANEGKRTMDAEPFLHQGHAVVLF
jgi:hypothetical protein